MTEKINVTIFNKVTTFNAAKTNRGYCRRVYKFLFKYAFLNFMDNPEVGYSDYDIDNLEYYINYSEKTVDSLTLSCGWVPYTKEELKKQNKTVDEYIKSDKKLNKMFKNAIRMYLKTKYQFDFKSFDFKVEFAE